MAGWYTQTEAYPLSQQNGEPNYLDTEDTLNFGHGQQGMMNVFGGANILGMPQHGLGDTMQDPGFVMPVFPPPQPQMPANAEMGLGLVQTSAPFLSGFDTRNYVGDNLCDYIPTERSSAAECKHCNMTYATPNGLRRHNLAVHERKTYRCTLCTVRKFSRNGGLSRHMKAKHPNEDRTKYKDTDECPVCPGKSFRRQDTLNVHMRKVHDQQKS